MNVKKVLAKLLKPLILPTKLRHFLPIYTVLVPIYLLFFHFLSLLQDIQFQFVTFNC